ncbi:MAG TPA: hypothetical protein VME46_18160, partial [Acidimicrobiales bacterium]|nr:hypothetical protein [Acidimicrobiales bacterium]
LPPGATGCHALVPTESPRECYGRGVKRRLFGTVERLPSKHYRAYYKHEGRRIYAQGTFATKADASAWLANTETELRRG